MEKCRHRIGMLPKGTFASLQRIIWSHFDFLGLHFLLKMGLTSCLGIITVLSFAPFQLGWVPIAVLAGWVVAIENTSSRREAFYLGLSWGLGFFGLGVQWVYTTVYTIGGMPQPLGWLMYILFAIYLSFYPGLVALGMKSLSLYCQSKKWHYSKTLLWSTLFPVLWVTSEMLRGEGNLGFNWMTLGYSQTSIPGLAGWARWTGVYGISFWLVMFAGLCGTLCLHSDHHPKSKLPHIKKGLILTLYFFVYGFGLWSLNHSWTKPLETIRVSLIQGNVPQENKWNDEWQLNIFKRYTRLLRESKGQLVVLPETALPVLKHQLPLSWLKDLQDEFATHQRTVLLGLVEKSTAKGSYYNSMASYGLYPDQNYHKRHLVPFGEFIPGRSVLQFFEQWWEMPLASFSRGVIDPTPLQVGKRLFLAPSICYEDGFSTLFRGKVDEAGILLNVSNDAWFGDGIAIDQHLQIAEMRTLEFDKPMIRSNNTAGTAIINSQGKIDAILPPFKEGTLDGYVVARTGRTPFSLFGNTGVLLMMGISLIIAAMGCLRKDNRET